MQENFTRTLAACRGEYVALLDGDDFWLPNKLQYQVDYLTAHPECSMCFHNVKMIYEDQPAHLRHSRREKEYRTLNDIIMTNFVATCAAMIRRETAVNLPAWYGKMRFEDWPLYILCAEKGLIGYLDEVLAVYRIHSRGAWSGRSAKNQLEEIVLFYEDLNRVLGFKYQKTIKRALSRHYFSFSLASAQDGNSSRVYALKSLQTNPFNVKAAVLLCSPSLFLRARRVYYYFFDHGAPKSPQLQDGK
jgi:glycosyltransferase involved in cell wall biosynthesis